MVIIKKVLDSGIITILNNICYEFSGEDYTDLIAKYSNLIISRYFPRLLALQEG